MRMPSYNLVCQLSHFAWGAVFLLATRAHWPEWWLGPGLLATWTLPKEFAWDILVEGDSWADSFMDFSVYWVGALVAWAWLWGASV